MDMYRALFITGLIIAIAFLILAVVLFFVLKIPKAVGIATGSTQKKAIEEIRASGYEARTRASRRNKERIRAREAELETGQVGGAKEESSGTQDKTGSTIEEAARKAAQEEAAASGNRKLSGRRGKGKKLGLENERTEVLGYDEEDDSNYTPTSGDPGEETDVLGRGDAYKANLKKEEPKKKFFTDEELKTDILNTANPSMQQRTADESLEAETALLSSDDPQAQELNMKQVMEEELTSVLQTPDEEDDIPLTTVLNGPFMKPEELDINSNRKKILVLLSETIVHTEESL